MTERKTFIPFGNSDPSLDYLLGILEDARVTTLQRVEGISTAELHWQFAEGWNTIGVLLSHIISAGEFFRIYFVEGRELTPSEKEQWMPGLEMGKFIPKLITGEPIEAYLSRMQEGRNRLLDTLRSLSTAEFIKKREGCYNKNTGFNLAWALYHLAEDEVHHRGQISILRKLYAMKNCEPRK
jgi:uncharacterized damage-inducible protein DinB